MNAQNPYVMQAHMGSTNPLTNIPRSAKTPDERKKLYRQMIGQNRSMLTPDEDQTLSRWGGWNVISVLGLCIQLPLSIRWYLKRNKMPKEASNYYARTLLVFGIGNFVLSYVGHIDDVFARKIIQNEMILAGGDPVEYQPPEEKPKLNQDSKTALLGDGVGQTS